MEMNQIETLKSQTHRHLVATNIAASGIPRSQIETDEFQGENLKIPRRARLSRDVVTIVGSRVACAKCHIVVHNDASLGNVGHTEKSTKQLERMRFAKLC